MSSVSRHRQETEQGDNIRLIPTLNRFEEVSCSQHPGWTDSDPKMPAKMTSSSTKIHYRQVMKTGSEQTVIRLCLQKLAGSPLCLRSAPEERSHIMSLMGTAPS